MQWSRIFKKLGDLRYLKHAAQYYPRKAVVLRRLARLKSYHSGAAHDFSGERNADLATIVNYAYRHCPYYQQLFTEAKMDMDDPISSFSTVPLLDKGLIRSCGDQIASSELHRLIHSTGNTGGSTGEPLKFLTSISFDPEHQAFLYGMMGYEDGDRILAMDGSRICDELTAENIFWTRKSDRDLPYGSMALSSLYLNRETIPHYINFLIDFKPDIIRGYPAFVNEIARYLAEKGIALPHPLKGVELTSESSSPAQIEKHRSCIRDESVSPVRPFRGVTLRIHHRRLLRILLLALLWIR